MTATTKTLVCTVAAIFFVLFVLTMFVPSSAARESASVYFFTDEIDTGLELAFQRRLFFWASTGLELTLLFVLSTSAWVRGFAERVRAKTGSRVIAALAVGLLYLVTDELLHLPLAIGRFNHARAWGMYNLDFLDWLRDHAIGLGLFAAEGAIIVIGLYLLLILLPRFWWLFAPVAASAFAIAYAFLAPILINPLFNDFTPLAETEWRDQQPRVQALIDHAGVPVEEILVMNGSRQSNHSNAYFTGFGPTRRIVLYDTLLKNQTPEEVESVLAHEIGHWQHDHITIGILLGTLAALVGCFVLDRLLRAAVGRSPWHLQSPADPAGLPLILLLVNLGTWAVLPVQNAVSRHFERQADETSLELAGRPDAFSACEQKMARTNKSNVAPTPWNVWLFSTHPTTVERIHTAEKWKAEHPFEGPEALRDAIFGVR